ncbi:19370_t:CDS:10 [Funneliformis geosporum]|uniref:15315_t:CDS:1 n=1 Tax=Funneliformis geosporum TaxID=1117311 RepID=A0A9W4SF22_9GLOM|nr:19370_t:CDS:10 [Funneliformis geosporum]CAI2164749.1 15315_t:CDS:10 [Funneliformis geosporum]
MGTTEKELTTRASYQNRDGFLTLFPRKLQWTTKSENEPIIDIAISNLKSKANVAEAKFKIVCNQEIAYTFVLTSQSAWDELEIIKARVTSGISRARSAAPSPAPQRSAATSPVHHRSTAPSPASGGSSPAVWNNNLQQNKNGATTNGRNGTTLPLRKMPSAKEINLRKNLLMRDKRLADQHRILVVEQKCIAEEEFWELRKNLLRDQDTRTSQQKGRSSTMPNLRPVTEEGGEAKINITPQLIHEIFEEYPRVKAAYDENVPDKITEELFWTRYVQSKFNDRNRAKTTTSIGNDDIFDKCWIETEEEREHGRKRLKISNLRDLNATKEDHMEIDFAPDITMRPGQGKILSLLRRNNRHGERILESACENSRRHKELISHQQKKEVYTEDIVMEDLIEEESLSTYKLDITDQREYFASQAAEIGNDVEMEQQSSIKHQSSTDLLNKFQEDFANWTLSLEIKNSLLESSIPNKVTKRCNEMIKDKQNRMRDSKPKIENLPRKIEKEVNIIQLMGYEFLRHFWASVGSSKEKVEKNKRMKEQLKSVLEKIDQVSELQPDEDYKQGLNNGVPDINTVQKGKDEQRTTVNGKRLKSGSRISSGQGGGNRLNSNESPKTDINIEWYDAIIQATQMLDPLYKAINKALAHDQQSTSPNISRTVNRQARQSISQNFQKSIVRELKQASPDHHRAISRETKTTSSPDIQRPMPRDIKQSQHHGMQKNLNREAKQITNPKIQRISSHDNQQSLSSDVQRHPNRQIKQNANMRQDTRQETSRVSPKVSVRSTTQVQNARPDIDRETAPVRTNIKFPKRNVQQNVSRDDWQLNGHETHQNTNRVAPKSSIVASRGSSGGTSGSSAQVSSANKIKNSTKRKR